MRPPEATMRKQTDAPCSFLVEIGTEFLPRVPGAHHHFFLCFGCPTMGIGMDLIFALMLFSGAIATIRQRVFMYLIVALTVLEFTADLIVEFNPSLGHGLGYALKVSGWPFWWS